MIRTFWDQWLDDYYFLGVKSSNIPSTIESALKRKLDIIHAGDCSSEQYEHAVKTFSKNPDPPGKIMTWVCRNNWNYLDLKKYPLNLNHRP